MKALMFMFGFLAIFAGYFVFAQAPVPPVDEAGLMAYLAQFISAVAAGDWKVIGGVAVMALMVGVRQYLMPKWKINPDHLPIVQAAIVAVSFAGMASLSPDVDLLTALKNGLLTSGVAGLAWELGGKWIFKTLLGIDLFKPVV